MSTNRKEVSLRLIKNFFGKHKKPVRNRHACSLQALEEIYESFN